MDLWSPPQEAESQIYVYEASDRLIVQWNRFSQLNVPKAEATFQAHVFSSGSILMSYGGINPLQTDEKLLQVKQIPHNLAQYYHSRLEYVRNISFRN